MSVMNAIKLVQTKSALSVVNSSKEYETACFFLFHRKLNAVIGGDLNLLRRKDESNTYLKTLKYLIL